MAPFRLDVVTLVPQAFTPLGELGVIGRAFASGIAALHTHNPRDYTTDRYHKVDDQPYGGGAGMVLKPEPVFAAVEAIPVQARRRVLLLTPQGKPLCQKDLHRWVVDHDQLVLICGHYEGFDERIRILADEEVSVGDFVLTGGELPAMTVINGVVRLLPGTVGTAESLQDESHSDVLLEHPHYTRPANFRGMVVPDVLRSGDHGAIALWRQQQRQLRTQHRRPDLYVRWSDQQQSSTLTMESHGSASMQFRIGNGYDIHRLVPGRPLILGGVTLDHPDGLGLDGHSDADVLVHALMDALLGALALGDIGKYFPPDDPRWKGADSLMLLEQVVALVRDRGWQVLNVDAVVVAERPKLKPHINAMRSNLAQRLGVELDAVGVKATTNEGLGPEGREEGMSSQAVALLQQIGLT
ncbi:MULTISPECIES: tRNA (guanosine(37)-N1)-methyltransferase TrmD [unclassified Prochlorococcus]|uniref:tRNA (guanosine(37)-N1)-methyltransferase TrmD n=1 Tax=unclassified Prochlorococcus TaxID=2627481 RepID=UPI000533750B|nr:MULTISPECIES: tRNA (guanosine(37)-N1)-methyltransferase TrmD [unclassified Prochlorococcus]KGG27267.1 putative bifuntional enzyme: tRNA methyltransferase [Prochlorococcus sp. MIT 0701]KGG30406.1 putative bifuntional enzyme: tRNA methyltransferase [Prochlorococcus sp. MIT 0702]KGG36544.1 putative bifuntional enzyme: tRNA methyltransferase [Prochlorococcus sp. MIT 0703]